MSLLKAAVGMTFKHELRQCQGPITPHHSQIEASQNRSGHGLQRGQTLNEAARTGSRKCCCSLQLSLIASARQSCFLIQAARHCMLLSNLQMSPLWTTLLKCNVRHSVWSILVLAALLTRLLPSGRTDHRCHSGSSVVPAHLDHAGTPLLLSYRPGQQGGWFL